MGNRAEGRDVVREGVGEERVIVRNINSRSMRQIEKPSVKALHNLFDELLAKEKVSKEDYYVNKEKIELQKKKGKKSRRKS